MANNALIWVLNDVFNGENLDREFINFHFSLLKKQVKGILGKCQAMQSNSVYNLESF